MLDQALFHMNLEQQPLKFSSTPPFMYSVDRCAALVSMSSRWYAHPQGLPLNKIAMRCLDNNSDSSAVEATAMRPVEAPPPPIQVTPSPLRLGRDCDYKASTAFTMKRVRE
jgi:hypothetical protein